MISYSVTDKFGLRYGRLLCHKVSLEEAFVYIDAHIGITILYSCES